MQKETLIIFMLDDERSVWFENASKQFGFGIKDVSNCSADTVIADLLAFDTPSAGEPKSNSDFSPFILFAHFSKEKLNAILDSYRLSGLKKIPLKAVLTKNNVRWTIRELYKDLKEEYEYMIQMLKTQGSVKK